MGFLLVIIGSGPQEATLPANMLCTEHSMPLLVGHVRSVEMVSFEPKKSDDG